MYIHANPMSDIILHDRFLRSFMALRTPTARNPRIYYLLGPVTPLCPAFEANAKLRKNKMKSEIVFVRLIIGVSILLFIGSAIPAQDNVRGTFEPVQRSIDPSKLTYNILVDGNLRQDDPANRNRGNRPAQSSLGYLH
jgi:hypothetical protein